MPRNRYDIAVNGKVLKDFEFIVGPMSAISIPPAPRSPEEFILASFEGGGTPIVGAREIEVDAYLEDIRQIRRAMGDRYFGVNILGLWHMATDFIRKFNELGEGSPDFLDINAVELDFEEILPLIKGIKVPVYMGISQPVSVYAFRKLLQKEPYHFLIDRFKDGTLKLYVPRNKGGGHLAILLKEQAGANWLDELVREIVGIEEEIKTPVPFIIEKGMLTVDDFVGTIKKYSQYPSLCGIRFASNLQLTRESGLSQEAKDLLMEIIREGRKEMIIPIRGNFAATKKKEKIRGGYVSYVVATAMARRIYETQCQGKDFPQYKRSFDPEILMHQANSTDKRVCHVCIKHCPMEFCEVKGIWDSVAPEGKLEDAIINITPRIFEIDPKYIGASATFVVRDMIDKTLSRIAGLPSGREAAN